MTTEHNEILREFTVRGDGTGDAVTHYPDVDAMVAEIVRLRAKVETARKIAKDYWESADEVAETVASDILEALDAE